MKSPSIVYGDETIEFCLTRNSLLRSKVRIHVHPNGLVEVEAPPSESTRSIQQAVQKRAGWIARQISTHALTRTHCLPREYESGETHFYLGRRYQLKVIKAAREPSSVALKGGQIRLALTNTDQTTVRRNLNNWYKARAQDYFSHRLDEVSGGVSWLRHAPPMKLVTMHKQWGSCSPKGAINLNPCLVKAPRECIDYVVLHELCHLREHNHSKRFYALLDKHMPEWRHTKARLDGMAELLLAS